MLPCLTQRATRTSSRWLNKRYHDYVRALNPGGGIMRIPLASPKVIGVVSSRGNRSHQEDHSSFVTLSLDPEELRLSVKKLGVDWDPSNVPEALSRQAVFIGIYDGHGGSAVSQYLRQELHGLVESVTKSTIPELYAWIQELGGYFKRFKGGALTPWIKGAEEPPFDLEARMTQAFFEVDRNLSGDNVAQSCGATASVAILHSLDAPATPFFASRKLALTVAHCGDTRVLLCSTDGGKVFPMTENHHADARVEAIRLRRMMGSSLITDSFGESRWMGALANTRCLGDLRYKKFGVTPEPEVRTKLLEGSEWAYLVLISDGISSMLSDSEVVDLARNAPDPKTAAENILSFAEELGGEDNATVIVVPLAGWGKIRGPDSTRELRDYRRHQAVGSERQRRM
ncbi:phosphatase 2C-like domain-containing protein [Mycena belliarum]|uniref:Phosphatase 2C-like domain-containing protein n=1 Tax=Mycena belliarum TaxID=1033014 RepID=A0AAD6UIL4_9AGAR|nr:phosphatase 2C-like domain-containing protein [Mycena belliae]